MRRALFQIHLWVGLFAGLYLTLMFLTGAALLFRIDMQRATYPSLFPTTSMAARVSPAAVLESVQARYPAARVAGVDSPTTTRSSYLSYVNEGGRFRTVLIDPASATVLGEIPRQSWIAWLQDLHFNLLAGRTGRLINGAGAFCLLALATSGLYLWLQGSYLRLRGHRALHATLAIWLALPLAGWAVTALYFCYPQGFRAAVASVWTLPTIRAPQVATQDAGAPSLNWAMLIAAAERSLPGSNIARVAIPSTLQSSFEVLFSDRQPTAAGSMNLRSVYVDPYTATVLSGPTTRRGFGDEILRWAGPLHVANFGIPWARWLWLLLALGMPVLWWTSMLMWWSRVARPRLYAWKAGDTP